MSSPQDGLQSRRAPEDEIERRGVENMIRLSGYLGREQIKGPQTERHADAPQARPDPEADVVTPFRPRPAPAREGESLVGVGGMEGDGPAGEAGYVTELRVTGDSLPQVLLLSVAMSLVLIAAVVTLASALFIFGGMA